MLLTGLLLANMAGASPNNITPVASDESFSLSDVVVLVQPIESPVENAI